MAAKSNKMHLLANLISLLDIQRARKGWLVVLCPTSASALACTQTLASLMPANIKFSGRTALLPSGKLSVACPSDPVFPTENFALAFIGWGETGTVTPGVEQWKNKALEILNIKVQ